MCSCSSWFFSPGCRFTQYIFCLKCYVELHPCFCYMSINLTAYSLLCYLRRWTLQELKCLSNVCPGSSGYHQKTCWPYQSYIYNGGLLFNPTSGLSYWRYNWLSSNRIFVEQVLIRLIGADEHIYANSVDSMQWLEDMDVPEMIVDKFSSSVSYIILFPKNSLIFPLK